MPKTPNSLIEENDSKNEVKGTSKGPESISEFLNEIIHKLQTDKLLNDTKTLDSEMLNFYTDLASGDTEKLLRMNKDAYLKQVYLRLIREYFSKLMQMDKPNSIGVNFKNSNMLIWAEISDENEILEDNLIRLQAETNAMFQDSGLNVNTTIVESSDHLKMPPHYEAIPIN